MLTKSRRPPLRKHLAKYELEGVGHHLHNGKNLEEVVFGKVLVWVMFVKLFNCQLSNPLARIS